MDCEDDYERTELAPVERFLDHSVWIITASPGQAFQGVLVKYLDGWLLIEDRRGNEICINRQQVVSVGICE